jgi:3-hydroxy-D-aspartate aldolase
MNRRRFLAVGAAFAAASVEAADDQYRGSTLEQLPTPALLVDLARLEANIRAMADHARRTGCALRPHAKTHKCPEIARRQVAAGALGVCVATVAEAEAMVGAGIRGVLLTSPIVDGGKCRRMAELARRGDVLLSLGAAAEVDLLERAARTLEVTLPVLIDLDVGDRRTGSLPGTPALELARQVARAGNLRLRGLQAYAGLASHVTGFERRSEVSRQALQQALDTRALFLREGLEAGILSCGSTGTYNIDAGLAGVTELQAGSYVFMDVDYRRIGGRSGAV